MFPSTLIRKNKLFNEAIFVNGLKFPEKGCAHSVRRLRCALNNERGGRQEKKN